MCVRGNVLVRSLRWSFGVSTYDRFTLFVLYERFYVSDKLHVTTRMSSLIRDLKTTFLKENVIFYYLSEDE